MVGHRSGARQGKAAMAGTKDTLAAHREFLLRVRNVILSHGYALLPIHEEQLRKYGIDPDTGERIDIQ